MLRRRRFELAWSAAHPAEGMCGSADISAGSEIAMSGYLEDGRVRRAPAWFGYLPAMFDAEGVGYFIKDIGGKEEGLELVRPQGGASGPLPLIWHQKSQVAQQSPACQNNYNDKVGGSSIPAITIKTGLAAPGGCEESLTEYMCDHPDCPNIATHVLGCVAELKLASVVCDQHVPQRRI